MVVVLKTNKPVEAEEPHNDDVVEGQLPQRVGKKCSRKSLNIIFGVVAGCLLVPSVMALVIYHIVFAEQTKLQLMYSVHTSDNSLATNISSDEHLNVVQYYTESEGQKSWILNDFNTGLQTTKIQTADSSICYVNTFNTTASMPPLRMTSAINFTANGDVNEPEIFTVSSKPIQEPSKILGSLASTLCQGIPVYWMYRSCLADLKVEPQLPSVPLNNTAGRSKRDLDDLLRFALTLLGSNGSCVKGCCYMVCCLNACGTMYCDSNGKQSCQFSCGTNGKVYCFNTC